MTEQKFEEIALRSAFASVEYEGYEYTDDEKDLCISAVRGSISKEDFIKILLERCVV